MTDRQLRIFSPCCRIIFRGSSRIKSAHSKYQKPTLTKKQSSGVVPLNFKLHCPVLLMSGIQPTTFTSQMHTGTYYIILYTETGQIRFWKLEFLSHTINSQVHSADAVSYWVRYIHSKEKRSSHKNLQITRLPSSYVLNTTNLALQGTTQCPCYNLPETKSKLGRGITNTVKLWRINLLLQAVFSCSKYCTVLYL